MEESIEWSARIDQALEEYPEVQEYLDAIRGNIEALAARIAAARELHPNVHGECHMCSDDRGPKPYPCPTIQAIEGE